MSYKYFLLLPYYFYILPLLAQPVEVQYDYTPEGDCVFSAYNNSKAPVYLHINFADLQNTSFPETLPYVKRLSPGFNALFTLQRDLDAEAPRFNYEVKSFRSNPMPDVDLNYPYLIPFAEGAKVNAFDVKDLHGFRGAQELDSWTASGFYANPGDKVCASRNGVVVEIAGAARNEDPHTWYNGWKYCITVLQPDGTLLCYRNVFDKEKKIEIGQQMYAGQVIGEIAPNANNLQLLIYHHSMNKKGLLFIIPQFVIEEGKLEIINSLTEYTVVHPVSVRGIEMTKREKKKILGKKK